MKLSTYRFGRRRVFRIKICGITNVEDARAAADAGADAIGLNFYEPSPRYVVPEIARQTAEAVGNAIAKVGVFVDAPASEILETFESVGLDWIQLHGDEPPELLAELGDRPVIKAMACREGGLGPLAEYPVAEYLERCRALDRLPRAVLIDAYAPGQVGGTGKVVDWDRLADWREALGGVPLVLAGGLTPENVDRAIATVRPRAVDTASGVESSPGKKDAVLMAAFVVAASAEFTRLGSGQQ